MAKSQLRNDRLAIREWRRLVLDVVTEMNSLRVSSPLSEQIGSTIQQRTGSRVRGLQIDVTERDIAISGRVDAYHVLQLVLEVVKDLQAEYRVPVCVQVQVIQRPAVT